MVGLCGGQCFGGLMCCAMIRRTFVVVCLSWAYVAAVICWAYVGVSGNVGLCGAVIRLAYVGAGLICAYVGSSDKVGLFGGQCLFGLMWGAVLIWDNLGGSV